MDSTYGISPETARPVRKPKRKHRPAQTRATCCSAKDGGDRQQHQRRHHQHQTFAGSIKYPTKWTQEHVDQAFSSR